MSHGHRVSSLLGSTCPQTRGGRTTGPLKSFDRRWNLFVLCAPWSPVLTRSVAKQWWATMARSSWMIWKSKAECTTGRHAGSKSFIDGLVYAPCKAVGQMVMMMMLVSWTCCLASQCPSVLLSKGAFLAPAVWMNWSAFSMLGGRTFRTWPDLVMTS